MTTSKKTFFIIVAFALSNIFSFGVGSYLRTESKVEGNLPLRSAPAESFLQMDSLIAAWTDDRTVSTAAMMGMTDNSGIFSVGTFPDTVRHLAAKVAEAYQVPAPVTLAQFALESRFGTRNLNANNFFGHTFPVALKYAPAPQRFVTLPTREFIGGKEKILTRKFAKYKSIGEAFGVHGRLLFNGYAGAQKYANDPAAYARAIGRRYATDPDYALKLITIMKRYKL